ncbi:probable G-protein coupled receptor 148 [Anguilla rostrata]|uniref:probable G-protein coupled receptor 148 n=1 Tax=Anguilla anguilla TaxID=7936 RepID=UPI0015A8609D|nr:probable G-protein coupled receptor 148 [Anguilla anguilla]
MNISPYDIGGTRASWSKMSNITAEWYEILQSWHMELFLIPTAVFTALALVANPLLLACILFSRALRQETRYLLLANTLLADTVFLAINLANLACNSLAVWMTRPLCGLVTAASVTAYCSSILTITLMAADTYAAVRWPLHYRNRLPPSRTRKILAAVWLAAAMYPVSLMIVMEVVEEGVPWRQAVCLVLLSLSSMGEEMMVGLHMYFFICAALCTALIVYCYARLYAVTKTSGIWQSRYSRARVTLLSHAVMLLLYFGPGLVFTVELVLFRRSSVSRDVSVWINTVNMSVLMPLPRACAPFLYGLRYREVYYTLLALFHRRRLSQVTVA